MGRVVLLIATLGASVGIALVAVPLARYHDPTDVSLERDGRTLPVVARSTDLATPTTLQLTWKPAEQVGAISGGGLVTDVPVAAGDHLECGQPVIEIDGRIRLALCGGRPLWRPLDGSSRGADADELAVLLFGEESSSRSTADRDSAIRALQRLAGWRPTGTIEPADLVWIRSARTVSDVDVSTGQRVEDGATLFTIAPVVTSAAIAPIGPGLDAGPLQVTVAGGPMLPLAPDGHVAGVAELSTLTELLLGRPTGPADPLPSSVDAVVQLVKPVELVVVPAGAIVSGIDRECVWTDSGPIEVTPVYSVVGDVYVRGRLASGTEIAVSPEKAIGC